MAKPEGFPDMNRLDLQDDTEDLFASPESGATTERRTPSAADSASKQRKRDRSQSEAREARLKAELARIREVNTMIEGVTASLTKAKGNMDTVQDTVNNASTLLATWTRILSQTEHNQRLILNPNWQGASKDVEHIENEELRRQQEAHRRVVEEQRRREDAQRRAEEEERRKAMTTPTGTRGRGTRGVRGVRGTASSTRGYGMGGSSTGAARGRGTTSTASRAGSGIGRGMAGTRGRGRGVG